ncbi:methyl-accepting chemotaxis protein [Paenibacillus ginsengarvi]|uniref:Methyl-accepting chemotaxis protein n=2 Tax=Paenibacillus ginsengarvi TaxID=400777 RepID=A0A3B0CK72_9BACL|nr:methyl-accepting chemotaxis protein [Paenibacillus ginsengarvi]
MSGADIRQLKQQLRLQNPVRSVGMKLLLIFFASIVSLVLIIGILSYQISKSIIKNKVADASQQTITQATDKVDFLLESMENITIQIMSDDAVADNMSKYKDKTLTQFDKLQTGQLVSSRLKSYVLANSKIGDINILPLNAEVTDTYRTTTPKDDVYKSDWFTKIKEADGKAVWLPTKKAGYVSTPNSFAVGRVLRNIKSSSVEGILIMELKTNALREALGVVSIGQGSSIAIIGKDNNVVYSETSEELETPYIVDVAANIAKTGIDSDNFEAVKDKEEILTVYDPIQKSDWLLVGTIPVGELVKDASTIFTLTIIMVLVAIVLAILVGLLVIRMIAHPLVSLRNLMMEGARGNLTVRVKDNGRQDEIGQLSASFNEMMEQITSLVSQTNLSAQEVLNTASELSDASRKTSISAKEIAVATEEIASGASSLAVEAERGSDLTGTINVKVGHVVEANAMMETAAAEVQTASRKGADYMSELITKTGTTEEMIRSMADKVEKLQESTSSIRKILDMLDNITKQTNILSLNATIEAARAGAAGKGFMVVADEIRKLADQSRQSIDVVAQITAKIQTEMKETVGVLSEAYPIFQEQITSVKNADDIFKQVQAQMDGFAGKLQEVTGSVEQLQESQHVLSEAMTNVSAVAEQSSATSQEVASLSSEQLSISDGLVKLSEKLEQLSNSLKESLSKFSI